MNADEHFDAWKRKWRLTITTRDFNRGRLYDARSFDDVRPEHRMAVAMLDAAVSGKEFNSGYREAYLKGVGVVEDYDDVGPLYRLDNF